MKIIADKNIPYLRGIAEHYGDVTYLSGSDFTKDSIKDADTLIVRTITHFDKEILEGSHVKLICSATIGYDHIDTHYCEQNGIIWRNAPGCNSGSVQQYIVSSLIVIAQKKNFDLKDKTIGIIGVGNVGRKVALACELLGMKVLLNDPPRQEKEGSSNFVDLDTIKKEADIITFHTPLIKEGKHKTLYLANSSFFEELKKTPIIINSARGSIIETTAIKHALKNNQISGAIIDCWEKEPTIDIDYMKMVDIATPHIAGYSADGKANATRMSLETIATFWKLPKDSINSIIIPNIADNIIDFNACNEVEDVFIKTYNPLLDQKQLLLEPNKFTELRGNYPLRRESFAYSVKNVPKNQIALLNSFKFKLI